MPGARTPGKFTRSNARDAPGKMTLEKVGPGSHKNRGFDSQKRVIALPSHRQCSPSFMKP